MFLYAIVCQWGTFARLPAVQRAAGPPQQERGAAGGRRQAQARLRAAPAHGAQGAPGRGAAHRAHALHHMHRQLRRTPQQIADSTWSKEAEIGEMGGKQ